MYNYQEYELRERSNALIEPRPNNVHIILVRIFLQDLACPVSVFFRSMAFNLDETLAVSSLSSSSKETNSGDNCNCSLLCYIKLQL